MIFWPLGVTISAQSSREYWFWVAGLSGTRKSNSTGFGPAAAVCARRIPARIRRRGALIMGFPEISGAVLGRRRRDGGLVLHPHAVDARGDAGRALEKDAHVLHVLEARELGDSLQGKVCLEEELADLPQLHAPDLRLRGAPDVLAELALHLAAGRVGVLQHLLDRDPTARLLPDEAERRGDVAVLDRKHVRRVPGHDPQRLDALVEGLRLLPGEKV